ncbi:YadA-like family protein [Vibrio sp. D420a]|uniref:YadA C-terminal domain-containing protein n=1 Tax=Vibrio sp. D420a TaxID=2836895 RepID=UPI002552F91A|nr:YadA C-terminal domain-containing protein [Vibrio sp. D420a]MDK9762478.1 YadA-like family protein [Vibrio sp. D420a]
MKKTIIAVALFTAFGAQAASKGQNVHIDNATQAKATAEAIHQAGVDRLNGKGQASHDLDRIQAQQKAREVFAKEALGGKGQASSNVVSEGAKKEMERAYTIDQNRIKSSKNADALSAQGKVIGQNATTSAVNSTHIAQNTASINQNAAEIKDLRKDLERQSKELSGAIAGVAAMSNIPNAQGVGNVAVGAGVGYYNSESAIAVGASYRYSDAVSAKMSMSAQSGNFDPVIGAGVSYEF